MRNYMYEDSIYENELSAQEQFYNIESNLGSDTIMSDTIVNSPQNRRFINSFQNKRFEQKYILFKRTNDLSQGHYQFDGPLSIIKKTIQKPQQVVIRKQIGEMICCQFCDAKFNKPSAIGGHMSKVHPGQSEKFKQKVLTSERRKKEKKKNTEIKNIILNDLKIY